MKVYTEVVWQWDEEKGELVEESSKSYDYEGPVVKAWDGKIGGSFGDFWNRNVEKPWKKSVDKQKEGETPMAKALGGGTFGQIVGGVMGTIFSPEHGWIAGTGLFPRPNEEGGDATGNVADPTKFGNVSQGAPGSWVRAQQGQGTTRTSTFLTRGTSAGKIRARQTASGSTGY